jgi:hypothetical protein
MTAPWSIVAAGALVAVFFAHPSMAQVIDKTKMLETTRRTCPNQFMQRKEFIDLLLAGGGNLTDFCECMAVRFSTQLDDADYGNEKALTAKWEVTANFCLAVSLKNK